MTMTTRTGKYRIGFREGNSPWQKDTSALATWAKTVGFELIDLGQAAADKVKAVRAAGLDVVSVDLLAWPALLSDDAGKRRDAVATNRARIGEMAAMGVRVFFSVV